MSELCSKGLNYFRRLSVFVGFLSGQDWKTEESRDCFFFFSPLVSEVFAKTSVPGLPSVGHLIPREHAGLEPAL